MILKYTTLVIITILSTITYYINIKQFNKTSNSDKNALIEINNYLIHTLYDNILEILPDYINKFDNSTANFTSLCHNYWIKNIELIFNKFLTNFNNNDNYNVWPSIQTENALNYINNSIINDNITFVKLRLRFKYNNINNSTDYYILPAIYCMNDKRINAKLNKYKLRDINHTIKYINKAINLNNLNKNEHNYSKIRHIDLLIHYSDCPIIWNSIPYNVVNNNTIEYEKCIINSKFCREIQYIIINNTSTYPIGYFNNVSNDMNVKHSFIYKTDINNITFKSNVIDIYNNSTEYICNNINNHINNIVNNININNSILCYGTTICYLPCYYNKLSDNDTYTDISEKLKESKINIFKILHCICKPNLSINQKLLIHSISTHNNTLDLGTIPYVNHLNNNEMIVRSIFLPNNIAWSDRNNTLFFIGRYTDTFRLDISCKIFNLLSSNNNTDDSYNLMTTHLNNSVYISDSNKISCNKRADFLEKKVKCDKDFICRSSSLSFNNWIELLLKSKFSLDISGVGPWSNRLRMLLLFGILIIQNNRSFISNQFYDLPLKKNQLIFKFEDQNDIINHINIMNKNLFISEKISKITSNFSLHCLSEYGLTLYYNVLLNKLIYFELLSKQPNNVSYLYFCIL